MLTSIAPGIWHAQHHFVVNGVDISSRMTVVRLRSGGLWLHSPIPIDAVLRAALAKLGPVAYIVAPSKTHHMFVADCVTAFPDAKLYGAPGLRIKRPDLSSMIELGADMPAAWRDDLDQLLFDGIPFANEIDWFHKPSKTLILTDLCQWWQGEMSLAARFYARLTGVRNQLAVPRTVQWLIRNRIAARDSAQKILQWPFERVVIAHNAIVERDAYLMVKDAFAKI